MGAFCNTLTCIIKQLSVLKANFWSFLECLLKTGFTVPAFSKGTLILYQNQSIVCLFFCACVRRFDGQRLGNLVVTFVKPHCDFCNLSAIVIFSHREGLSAVTSSVRPGLNTDRQHQPLVKLLLGHLPPDDISSCNSGNNSLQVHSIKFTLAPSL